MMTAKNTSFGASLLKDLKKYKVAYLMAVPAVVLLFVFKYIPMYGLVIVFENYKPVRGIFGSQWVGLKNFADFFGNSNFTILLRNTLVMSLYSLFAGFPAPIILALLLNEVRAPRFKKTVQTITYMPYFISTVVICGILGQFLSFDGLFNALGALTGKGPVSYLSEPKLFPTIIVWSGIWQTIGWNSIIYMAALAAVDVELYEAASIDGCGKLRQIWHITLPGIVPTIITLLILSIGGLLNVATDKILLLYTPLTYETGDVFGTYVYRKGIRGGDYSYSTAVGLVQTVVNFGLLVFSNFVSKRVTEQSLW